MINVYDFDGTIYNGDSSVDFYRFCLMRNKKVLLCLPIQIFGVVLYLFRIKNKTYLKEKFFSFLKKMDHIDDDVKAFWNEHEKKIAPWYLEQKEKTDLIISASPEFLLKPLEKKLKVEVIATKVDKKTGKLNSLNCHDVEKVRRYEEKYPKGTIQKFYSDSIQADRPMFVYAKEAYLVKKGTIQKVRKDDLK